MRLFGLWVAILLWVPGLVVAVGEPDLQIEAVGVAPSSFPLLLWLHVRNGTYNPLNLMDMMAGSQLLIDGKPSRRSNAFTGPSGIPAAGEWDGCLSFDEFTPKPAPGRHQLRFVMGGAQSNEASVRYEEPKNWRKGNLAQRVKEVKALSKAIKKDMPRACVEQWLTRTDGGPEESQGVRYDVEPQLKVTVPYSTAGTHGHDDEVVNGSAQVYQEPRSE